MAKRASPFPGAEKFMPERIALPTLREASKGCQGCDLYKTGTQTVFGEGPKSAFVMFVGEQPGDQEDRAGKPFVGPSGQVLDETLEKVGIDRTETYVTNTVKHFKWEPRGKRRIHAKPNAREIEACVPWLKAEVEAVRPFILVPMGATAGQAILGKEFRVTQERGKAIHDSPWAPCIIATVHPSSILRMPDEAAREQAMRAFEQDMRIVAKELAREKATDQKHPPAFVPPIAEQVAQAHYHAH
jgi:uracil-DNA glycosylase family protein